MSREITESVSVPLIIKSASTAEIRSNHWTSVAGKPV
jgi:hypothetical protein